MTAKRRKKKSNKGIIFLILTAIVAVIAFLTNPDELAHQKAMQARSGAVLSEIVAEQNPIIQTAWGLTGNRLLNEFVNAYVTTDNYYLFSVTKVNWEGQSYPVGAGAFGNVYITKQLNKNLIQPMIYDAKNKVINSVPPFLRIIFQ
ncbi:MAG: hypothetical protein LBI15_02150 [Dysgonamonadaceae bacterium]|jgi:hypothetical protein|nr:hypothetical protein [Dysgonamonadaceae bacterium]